MNWIWGGCRSTVELLDLWPTIRSILDYLTNQANGLIIDDFSITGNLIRRLSIRSLRSNRIIYFINFLSLLNILA